MHLATCALLALATHAAVNDPRPDDFDFWLGTWTVTNTQLDRATNTRNETGTAEARIRTVAAGRAILEEWNGIEGPIQNTFGISLRYHNPDYDRWVIILNWPGGTNPNPAFGVMQGGFTGQGENARGEFYPPNAFTGPGPTPDNPRTTRFTFSEPRAESCRWDMAVPTGRGDHTTTWIMDFARTGSHEDSQAAAKPVPAPDDCACDAPGARDLDPIHGSWSGPGQRRTNNEWTDSNATLHATAAARGCLTLLELTESPQAADPIEHFEAWAYNTQTQQWGGVSIRSDHERAQGFAATHDNAWTATPTGSAATRDTATRRRYELADDGSLRVTLESRDAEGWTKTARYTLERTTDPSGG